MIKRAGVVIGIFLLLAIWGAAGINAQNFGAGWTAVFFPNTNFSGTGFTVSGINGINFNWGQGAPTVNGVFPLGNTQVDNFSVRFTSTQNFTAGTYRFTVTVDDNVRVLIDGQVALEDFSGGPVKTLTFDRTLTDGPHTITVEYVEVSAEALIQFQWGAPGAVAQPTAVGPTPTPGPTATPAPTGLPPIPQGALSATVIRATVLNVRAAPFLGAPRVGRVLRGQTYQVVGRDPDARWFLLQLSNQQAWAYGYYLAVNGNEFNAPVVGSFATAGQPASEANVVAQSQAGLRLRAEPTTNSAQIGRIPWGDLLPVLGRTADGQWWQVSFRGTVGWIASPFVRVVEGDITTIPVIR